MQRRGPAISALRPCSDDAGVGSVNINDIMLPFSGVSLGRGPVGPAVRAFRRFGAIAQAITRRPSPTHLRRGREEDGRGDLLTACEADDVLRHHVEVRLGQGHVR